MQFVALAKISDVDNWYRDALPVNLNTFKYKQVELAKQPFKATTHNRNFKYGEKPLKYSDFANGILWVFYKLIRIFYASFIYYFLPYIVIMLPFFASSKWIEILDLFKYVYMNYLKIK